MFCLTCDTRLRLSLAEVSGIDAVDDSGQRDYGFVISVSWVRAIKEIGAASITGNERPNGHIRRKSLEFGTARTREA